MVWAKDVRRFINYLLFLFALSITAFLAFKSGYFTAYFVSLDRSKSEFANLAVLIGSISTAITFAFLIWQNSRIREQQKATENRQQQFEKQQQKLWDAQQEQIQFEKYLAHKREFFKMLDDIESSAKLDIEFYHREALYRRIFPLNDFSNVNFKAKISETEKQFEGGISSISKAYFSAEGIFNQFYDIPLNDEKKERLISSIFMSSLSQLSINLQLKIKHKASLGDITFEDRLLINVYEPTKTLTIFREAFESICIFTKNDVISPLSFVFSQPVVNNIQYNIFTYIGQSKRFTFHVDDNNYAKGMYELYNFLNDPDIKTISELQNTYNDLHVYMNDADKISILIGDTELLKSTIKGIFYTLHSEKNNFSETHINKLKEIQIALHSLVPTNFLFGRRRIFSKKNSPIKEGV